MSCSYNNPLSIVSILKFYPCFCFASLLHWNDGYQWLHFVILSSLGTESTLHMLGTNEVQEAVHMTTNSEKLEADLIYALNNVLGRSYGKHLNFFIYWSNSV